MGAATWGNGASGSSGAVTTTNSLELAAALTTRWAAFGWWR